MLSVTCAQREADLGVRAPICRAGVCRAAPRERTDLGRIINKKYMEAACTDPVLQKAGAKLSDMPILSDSQNCCETCD
eukprot:6199641-Pleurochrysis_carterae.AAC.1